MHNARTLLENGSGAARRLARRGYDLDLPALRDLARQRSELTGAVDKLRTEANRLARELRRAGAETASLRERAREVKTEIQSLEARRRAVTRELDDVLLTIPNLPDDDVPDGATEDEAVELRRCGTVPAFDFTPRDHVEIGEAMGILDFRRATRLAGARFAVTRGAGAVLERALASFFLDLHTRRHGYEEVGLPALVNRAAMTGTGQLPKFADDLFTVRTADRELFLIPTAEVPLVNLYAGETLAAGTLPVAVTAYTPCFRAEAGSYGKDTRGILRLHQFGKVELVRLCRPEDSAAELERMVGHAETCLAELGLAYRVVALAAGDLGFSACRTYDIEVWLPSQGRYREVSSCSDCGTFQARRADIRMRDRSGERGLPATLNASGLPIGRTLAAILEQRQRPDGGVDLPEALAAYTGFRRIDKDGTPRT
ncbi:serine--tRNA ligase [Microbispora sp. RL4-1S]|uniref:Serine--tRNA ligase n=1 Tax=Microbispora oryzae TaxID=2806554 RepID=A0A940WSW5_9ACTN|nr:serine--tRNA ligase [Microbispora oryzae]MBP2706830.1 serine--tRNA ligase [Microbispora oryzae]